MTKEDISKLSEKQLNVLHTRLLNEYEKRSSHQMTKFIFMLPISMDLDLAAASAKRHMSKAAIVREAIRKYLSSE